MIRPAVFGVVCAAAFFANGWIALAILFAYALAFGGIEIVFVAIFFDVWFGTQTMTGIYTAVTALVVVASAGIRRRLWIS